MYQAASNERNVLKADLETSERKLQKSLQRQQLLEKKYEQQREKNKKLEKILSELKNEVLKMQVIEDKNNSMASAARSSDADAGKYFLKSTSLRD